MCYNEPFKLESCKEIIQFPKKEERKMRMKKLLLPLLALMIFVLSGCGAVNTMIKKRNLDVQTKMSETIWLEPVSENARTVFVQVRNTTGKQLQVEQAVKQLLTQKGYMVVNDPKMATYWLQANILKMDKTDLRESDPFGSGILGAGVGAALGAYNTGSVNTAIGLGIAGALISGAVDALVTDISYVMITDLLISEKTTSKVYVDNKSNVSQGTKGSKTVSSSAVMDKNQYQTRVVSVANQVNLKFEEAQPALEAQLQQVISGIF